MIHAPLLAMGMAKVQLIQVDFEVEGPLLQGSRLLVWTRDLFPGIHDKAAARPPVSEAHCTFCLWVQHGDHGGVSQDYSGSFHNKNKIYPREIPIRKLLLWRNRDQDGSKCSIVDKIDSRKDKKKDGKIVQITNAMLPGAIDAPYRTEQTADSDYDYDNDAVIMGGISSELQMSKDLNRHAKVH